MNSDLSFPLTVVCDSLPAIEDGRRVPPSELQEHLGRQQRLVILGFRHDRGRDREEEENGASG